MGMYWCDEHNRSIGDGVKCPECEARNAIMEQPDIMKSILSELRQIKAMLKEQK